MKQMPAVFAIVLMTIILASACGPTTPTPAQPTEGVQQVVKIEATPTMAQIIPATLAPAEATASTGCPPPAGWSAYTVQRGDTLYALAKQVNQTPEELMQANCLTSSLLSVGATLYLPLESCTITPPEGWPSYSVRSGDTLSSLATARNTTVAEIKRVNCLVSDSLDVGKQLYLPPAPPASPAPPAPPAPVAPAPAVQPQAPAPEPGGGEAALPSELYNIPIQAPPWAPLPCPDSPPAVPPAIVIAGLMSHYDRLVLCLYGFPNSKEVTVSFYTKDGGLGYDRLRVKPNDEGGGDVISTLSEAKAGNVITGTSNLELFPWWPIELPETVFVEASSADIIAREIIRNVEWGRHVGFLRSIQYVPFPDVSFDETNDCIVVNAPATLQFLGAGFMQGQRIPIGLYARQNPVTYTLSITASGQAITDREGRFQFPVVATPGVYLAVADPITTTLTANPWVDCYQFR